MTDVLYNRTLLIKLTRLSRLSRVGIEIYSTEKKNVKINNKNVVVRNHKKNVTKSSKLTWLSVRTKTSTSRNLALGVCVIRLAILWFLMLFQAMLKQNSTNYNNKKAGYEESLLTTLLNSYRLFSQYLCRSTFYQWQLCTGTTWYVHSNVFFCNNSLTNNYWLTG